MIPVMKNDPLLLPYKIKHLEFKNRLMISAHEPSYAEEGLMIDPVSIRAGCRKDVNKIKGRVEH